MSELISFSLFLSLYLQLIILDESCIENIYIYIAKEFNNLYLQMDINNSTYVVSIGIMSRYCKNSFGWNLQVGLYKCEM